MADPRRTRLNRRTDRNTEKEPEKPIPQADFSEAQKRSEYLKHKLDDILDNIGQSYGKRMADELMKRLEKTIIDFNAEVVRMLDKLEVLENQRLKETSAKNASEISPENEKEDSSEENLESEEEFANMSEFEKRIEMLERKRKESEKEAENAAAEETEKPKKRGWFRKKNK
ncbi:MAG: hypothetical protein DRP96_08660 [Candidatus Neomarinimicrobiota bacterium]|nr:MAG: hypothetical protein DRP96_08660 [Candidatus Neomarinimicrobiota bacterium]